LASKREKKGRIMIYKVTQHGVDGYARSRYFSSKKEAEREIRKRKNQIRDDDLDMRLHWWRLDDQEGDKPKRKTWNNLLEDGGATGAATDFSIHEMRTPMSKEHMIDLLNWQAQWEPEMDPREV
jgi:hypothetical protein